MNPARRNDMEIAIKKLEAAQDGNMANAVPYDLLLLADPSKTLIDYYLKRGLCFTASIEGHVIAVYVLLDTRPETMEIVNIAVREEYQGIGIGRKLILHAVDIARAMKAKTLEVGTGNSSVQPLMLYQKCGFRITGIDKDFFVRHYKEAIFENGIPCRDMVRLSMDL
jgi:ribosomal protein S18 acetylase RimI-like enzyme